MVTNWEVKVYDEGGSGIDWPKATEFIERRNLKGVYTHYPDPRHKSARPALCITLSDIPDGMGMPH
ncbi:hypothetical protein [Saccharicrinis sp. GN24d3]|uniref:hypothetical protein n=1 Tax=Saccharicrinis sp. GN24d3 TaxID=3458416 RepID=UPI00403611BD